MKPSSIAMALILVLLHTATVKAEMFAGYDEFCGLPVVVGVDPQVASARIDRGGNKYIYIDSGAMLNWTMSRIFALAHECAHHILGHTDPLGQLQRYYGGTATQELEADCWAAMKLKSVGYDREITRTILERANEGHFSGNNYPSGITRARYIATCASQNAGTKAPRCRNVQVPETYMDVQVVMQPVQIPCQHCGCNPWGQCGCLHMFDVVNQRVQVPVQRTRMITQQVCD